MTLAQLRDIESPWRRRWLTILLSMGLDPNLREGSSSTTGAISGRHRNTNANESLLHFASRAGFTDLTELLLEHGANPHAVDDHGATPLHLAAAAGHADVALLLVKNGAALTVADQRGRLPYQLAGHALQSGPFQALRQQLTPPTVTLIAPAERPKLDPVRVRVPP